MESHLLQMRGLKLLWDQITYKQIKSHLLQMRGLKLQGAAYAKTLAEVASFTDAWIETIISL